MSLFNRKRETQEQQDYESYMTGFRLGFPVADDEPTNLYIDPHNPEFRRGLTDGVHNYQEDRLAEHPEHCAGDDEEEEACEEVTGERCGGLLGWLFG